MIEAESEPNDIPRARMIPRLDPPRVVVIITAYQAGTKEPATIEMRLEQWMDLLPVQYVVKLQLSKQQPRRPTQTNGSDAESPVPRGHIEWRDGQNWVVVTAARADTGEPVTFEMTLAQWFTFAPVQWATDFRLGRWREHKEIFGPRPRFIKNH
jgi:hypothetical protein